MRKALADAEEVRARKFARVIKARDEFERVEHFGKLVAEEVLSSRNLAVVERLFA